MRLADSDIFPQGFSSVADCLREFRGINMPCDFGNGTMNVMYINECRPVQKKCFTEKIWHTSVHAHRARKPHAVVETREEEDAFLQKVLETIQAGVSSFHLSFPVQPSVGAQISPEPSDEDVTAVLNFADSF